MVFPCGKRGDGNKTNNHCPQKASREVCLVFASRFQKTPGGSEFSGAQLEKYRSNLIFRSAELSSPGNQTSLPLLYLGTQKTTRHFQKRVPLCLPDPNDPTSYFVQVLDTVTAAPQPELSDRGGLDPQPLILSGCNQGQKCDSHAYAREQFMSHSFLWLLFHANS